MHSRNISNCFVQQLYVRVALEASASYVTLEQNCYFCLILATRPPIRCQRPVTLPAFVTITPNFNQQSWAVGEIITYACNGNFIIQGSRTARCLPSGQFSNGPPRCISPRKQSSAFSNFFCAYMNSLVCSYDSSIYCGLFTP